MSLLDRLKDKSKVAEFISKLFILTIQSHIFHLQVKGKGSFAIHMALNDLYQAVPGITDSIVEAYQGKYGILNGYALESPVDFTDRQQIVDYLGIIHEYIDNNRAIFKDSDILNTIDELKSLLKGTLYKLKNLE